LLRYDEQAKRGEETALIYTVYHVISTIGQVKEMTNISSLIRKEISLSIICSVIASCVFLPSDFSHAQTRSVVGISHPNKVVILTFGDTKKSQFTNAKPILDKYGFKGSFFITCLWAGSSNSRLTWQDISILQKDGQDIESKAMTHLRMTHLSP
jgi:hypothetical protein